MGVRVLLIGSGSREHALAGRSWRTRPWMRSSPRRAAASPPIAELRSVAITDPSAVAALAVEVVAGIWWWWVRRAPLVAGVADAVRGKGIACFGPSGAAAQLEGSKAFAKDVMAAAGVPTARAYVCRTDDEAQAALDEFGPPYVVKDDGLAAERGRGHR